MSDVVHLLWFAKEMPEGEEDIELLIGVYSSNKEASAASWARRRTAASCWLMVLAARCRDSRYMR